MRRRSRSQSTFSESRRVFIHRLTFFGGGVVLLGAACKCSDEPKAAPPKRQAGVQPKILTTSHRTFTDDEFAVVRAAAERILPRDEDPGALDADVPVYIDRMLTSPDLAQMKEDFIGGVRALDRRARGVFEKGFAACAPHEQDRLLTDFKDSNPSSGEAKFYELLVVLTLEGFLGDPSYGGNKGAVGWALVGFNTMAPPPGYDGLKALHKHHDHGSHAHGGTP